MKAPYPRLRQNGSPETTSLHILTTFATGTPAPTENTVYGADAGMTEVMHDIVTPNFTARKNNGEIINNYMYKLTKNIRYATCNFKTTITHPTPQPNAQTTLSTGKVGYFRTDLNNSAVGSFNRHCEPLEFIIDKTRLCQLAAIKARNGISPVNLQALVSAVEFPKTLDLIYKTVQSLRQIRKSVVTGNPNFALRAIGGKPRNGITVRSYAKKTAENRWLEFRYGWTPLIMEVQGAIKALDPTRIVPLRGTSRGFQNDVKLKTLNTSRDYASVGLINWVTTRRETASARAYCLYTADLQYQRARDFGVTEVPLAIWELVPYSFVVDWFIPVGNWLEALTPKLGVKVLAEGVSFKRDTRIERTAVSWTKQIVGGFSYDTSGTFFGATDVIEMRDIERNPNLNVLLNLPPFDVKLNTKRVIDAIALLRI